MVYKRKNGAGHHGRNTTASPAQVLVWQNAKAGDILRILLRSGNVQRFEVVEWPAHERPRPGQVHAIKCGQGRNSPIRNIAAFEIVTEE